MHTARALFVVLLVLPACPDDTALTCAEVYTEACRSAFDGQCSPLGLDGTDTEVGCIEARTERPRPGDEQYVTGYGEGRFGCRWMHPETDLGRCYELTAHKNCADDAARAQWSSDFLNFCVANWGDWRDY